LHVGRERRAAGDDALDAPAQDAADLAEDEAVPHKRCAHPAGVEIGHAGYKALGKESAFDGARGGDARSDGIVHAVKHGGRGREEGGLDKGRVAQLRGCHHLHLGARRGERAWG